MLILPLSLPPILRTQVQEPGVQLLPQDGVGPRKLQVCGAVPVALRSSAQGPARGRPTIFPEVMDSEDGARRTCVVVRGGLYVHLISLCMVCKERRGKRNSIKKGLEGLRYVIKYP